MLVSFKEIITKAMEDGCAIGSFNTMNLEITQAIVNGAKSANFPIIIQISENIVKYSGLKTIYYLTKSIIEDESGDLPITFHLDHGKNLDLVKAAIDIGFPSVHMDASALPFEDNIRLTKEAADYAHSHNAWLQGELGNILGAEGLIRFKQNQNLKEVLTRPEQVQEFVEKTNVDTLAVSLGNLHGHFITQEELDFDRLTKINSITEVPLVLHGGSGISIEQIKEAIKLGIRIINVDTDLRIAFAQALRESLTMEKELIDPRKILAPAKEAISRKVEEMINIFKS